MTVFATALAALSHARERVDDAAEGVAKSTRPAVEASNQAVGPVDQLDLSTEAVHLLAAKNGYDAALELAKTADEMSQRTIDLLG